MFDSKEFFECLKGNRMTVASLAEALGINRATLYRKVAGDSDFTRKEIQKCREIFGVEACNAIFFAVEVTQTKQMEG